jgi:hypothetical protein
VALQNRVVQSRTERLSDYCKRCRNVRIRRIKERGLDRRRQRFWIIELPSGNFRPQGKSLHSSFWYTAGIVFSHRSRCGILIRFQPEIRASTDQHPGPNSDRTAPRLASKTLSQRLQLCEYTPNSSTATTMTPVIRVHKPSDSRIPSTIAMRRSVISSRLPLSCACQQATANAVPVATRRSSSPRLGRASAKLGYSGRKTL